MNAPAAAPPPGGVRLLPPRGPRQRAAEAGRRGDLAGAALHALLALREAPADATLAIEAGRALAAFGRHEEAATLLERALRLAPADPAALLELSNLRAGQRRFDDAAVLCEQALGLPGVDRIAALNNLAIALAEAGRLDEAVARLRELVALAPGLGTAHGNLGNGLISFGRVEEAVASYARKVELEPDNPEAWTEWLGAMNYGPADPRQVAAAHRAYAARFEAPYADLIAPHANDRNPERRLKLGYVSSDLRRHSVAFFIEPVLAAHDPARFEVHVYAASPVADEVTGRLRALAPRWTVIATASDDEVEQRIRADGIDILVDLNGHTEGNRLPLFARRPAPVQVTWLGYPNTTGLAGIDYRLTDARADPPGDTEALHSERLVRLPDGFLCFRPPDGAPEPGPLPMASHGAPTFGTLNNRAKIGPAAIDAWARLLAAVPAARLMLKVRGRDDAGARAELVAAFAARGIDAARIVVVGRQDAAAEHLARYREIDVALDTFPYAGTTTTCDALWMGVPVVSLAGPVHAGRVGASLLHTVGLPDLVTGSLDDYVACAAGLVADRERLARLRAGLRAQVAGSPLVDARRFTRALEDAYRTMWRTWCSPR